MPCLVALLAYFAPRFAIVLVVLFSDYLGTAYESLLVPFLGFFFAPLTTLAYAWAIHSRGSVEGFALVVVVLAVLADLGLIGRAAKERKRGRRE
ncbi:MAG TPA: hypothetical protein VF530_22305, partial [Planctomycetota bacterium]